MRLVLIISLLVFRSMTLLAQEYELAGKVVDDETGFGVKTVQVEVVELGLTTMTDDKGRFSFSSLNPGNYTLKLRSLEYEEKEVSVTLNEDMSIKIVAVPDYFMLGEHTVEGGRESTAGLARLREVEGTSIYSAKKNDVILTDELTANRATNNPRQIYNRVAGLNVWESDGAGIQLGIGGRGLNPHRTSNFNVRQDGYDIAADALGYPESYYTPPTEAIERIEIVRGAASLQYGTSFGGLLNFRMKDGGDEPFSLVARNTVGSYGFLNSFTSVGGKKRRFNYYGFYQRKQGDGWRQNSEFQVNNAFAHLQWHFNEDHRIKLQLTHFDYLSRQAGGLTDNLFEDDAQQSIRDRNWFKVDWNIAAVQYEAEFSPRTRFDTRFFGLLAERSSIGHLGRIDRIDPGEERDLIYGKFRNWGNETRLVHIYHGDSLPWVVLVGARYYQGNTIGKQGLGDTSSLPTFDFNDPENPYYYDYRFPSRNFALFAENIFHLSRRWTVTPGARFEFIKTAAVGRYTLRFTDLAGNIIEQYDIEEDRSRERTILLLGIGTSYDISDKIESYANISQNYRAINFNDMRVVNPNFRVDSTLKDERGFNADLGVRGSFGDGRFNFDVSAFFLYYQDRIGLISQKDELLNSTYMYRTNVADSRNYGVEAYIEGKAAQWLTRDSMDAWFSVFVNGALTQAEYINSNEPGIDGNVVELVPPVIVRTGANLVIGNLMASYQIGHTAEHFSDATNAEFTPNAVYGLIPAYTVHDLSISYRLNRYIKFETGINNVTDTQYFTQRASGYPGPGILPSDGRTMYFTLELNL